MVCHFPGSMIVAFTPLVVFSKAVAHVFWRKYRTICDTHRCLLVEPPLRTQFSTSILLSTAFHSFSLSCLSLLLFQPILHCRSQLVFSLPWQNTRTVVPNPTLWKHAAEAQRNDVAVKPPKPHSSHRYRPKYWLHLPPPRHRQAAVASDVPVPNATPNLVSLRGRSRS